MNQKEKEKKKDRLTFLCICILDFSEIFTDDKHEKVI